MKKIKEMQITGTFTVGLDDVEVADEQYEALMRIHSKGGDVGNDDIADFLRNNINFQVDCFDDSYNIEDLVV